MPIKSKTNSQIYIEIDGEMIPLKEAVVMRPKIKPCPFCGEIADTFQIPENDEKEMSQHPNWKWNNPGMWVIGCDTGMCIGNMFHVSMVFVNEESAIETWNRRKYNFEEPKTVDRS